MAEPVMNPINSSGQVHIKRTGNVATIFVDMVSDTPLPLSGYDDSPDTAFPVTITVDDAIAAYGNRIVWHNAPVKNNPIAKTDLTPEQMEQKIREVVGSQQPEVAPLPYITPSPGARPSVINLDDKVLNEFKLLLVKYDALEGKKKAHFGVQVTAVANFILSIAPDLAPALQAIKDEISKPKFTL
jgi:hypothetical protein